MALAETANLAVNLTLGGNFQAGLGQAEAGLGRFNTAAATGGSKAGILNGVFGSMGKAASGLGGALGHAKNQLVGLLTGPLGMLGLGAGLFSLGGLFKSGIDKAREFGGEVKRLAAITGLSVDVTSRLAGAFDHFGISADTVARIAGLFEKNLFALTQTTVKHGKTVSSAADFSKKYGLSLVDAKGHVRDFNDQLLTAADFWNNKGIPAQTKAAALAKLYGRNWQELVPILAAGRKGITAAEEEAARLGLTITKDNIDALTKAKEATRTWGDALGGLKLQIGLAVLPVLTDLTKNLTGLVVNNRDKIVGFLKGMIEGGYSLAKAFANFVWPALQSVGSILGTMFNSVGGISFSAILHDSANFAKDLGNALNSFVVPGVKAIVGAWDALPADFRSLIIKGFIANKVIKWTFGFDAVGFGLQFAKTFVANIAGKLTADVGGALASIGIGKAFVQHVWVDNMGLGGNGPSNNPVTDAAKFGIPTLATLASAATAISISLIPLFAAGLVLNMITPEQRAAQQEAARRATILARGGDPTNAPTGVRGAPRSSVPSSQWRNGVAPTSGDFRGLSEGNRAIVDRVTSARDKIEATRVSFVAGLVKLGTRIDASRDGISRGLQPLKAGLDQSKAALSTKMALLERAEHAGAASIVSAIHGINLNVNVTTSVHGDHISTGIETGKTVHRTGGSRVNSGRVTSTSGGGSGVTGTGHGI